MTSTKVREKYINFFKSKDHKEIPASPLVLKDDPTTLFTSAGMQPLVPYLLGEKHPLGRRLVDSQPCLRTQDIEEVGDTSHTTFFEMLGNWSLGDYFKKEQLSWIWEFFTKELSLPKDKLYTTLFEGDKEVPKDVESYEIWKKLGIPDERIYYYGAKKNWWSRSGTPNKMPDGEIGGPDSEIFFDFGKDLKLHEKSKWGDKECHPNCECGRFLEIGNSVFMQYKKSGGKLVELSQKSVDFGGGLERITAAINDDIDIFKIDTYWPTIEKLEKMSGQKYEDNVRDFRIVADHLRASEALIKEGVVPSNKQQGYVLRRLIRRMAIKFGDIVDVTDNKVILEEITKFKSTLEAGLKKVKKIDKIDAKTAFYLYESYGFPFELTEEIAKKRGQKINKKEFEKELERHKKLSKAASSGMFKGGLVDNSKDTVKLHTATHLLHESLRRVLGDVVSQKGSNITSERLRFDFSYPKKLTEDEIKKVEDLVNEEIKKDLVVSFSEMTLDKAKKEGALAFFGEKYTDAVKVYKIGGFSKEVCGGPHVKKTSEVGHVRIKKQEKIGSNLIRIYAYLE